MPVIGDVWAANTWDVDAWAANTWAGAIEGEDFTAKHTYTVEGMIRYPAVKLMTRTHTVNEMTRTETVT